MRMRKLGKNHWLSFWSSNEVHHQIGILKQNITLVDILRWVYENSQQETFYTNDIMKQLAQNCLEN